MTEVNYRRNGRRYSKGKDRYLRFYWVTKQCGLYLGTTHSARYKRQAKRLIARTTRRKTKVNRRDIDPGDFSTSEPLWLSVSPLWHGA